MHFVATILIFASAACASSSPSPISCELAGDHLHALINAKRLRTNVADLCNDRDWSATARACVAGVHSIDELHSCAGELGASANALDKAVRDEQLRQVDEADTEAKRAGPKVYLRPNTEVAPTRESLVVELSPGKVIVGGKEFADLDLDNLFRAAYARDHAVQVVLKASRGIPHGRVVELMERAKAAGITRLAIGTAP